MSTSKLNSSTNNFHPTSSSKQHATTNTNDKNPPLVLVIAGPTGVGKSAVAAHLCHPSTATQILSSHHHHDSYNSNSATGEAAAAGEAEAAAVAVGHIVSADSVQAYQGVQIGANKPTQKERQEIVHHLVDVFAGKQEEGHYTAAQWKRDCVDILDRLTAPPSSSTTTISSSTLSNTAKEKVEVQEVEQEPELELKQKILPVVVGGTMMYVQWLVHGQPDAPRPPKEAVDKAAQIIDKYQRMEEDYQHQLQLQLQLQNLNLENVKQWKGEEWEQEEFVGGEGEEGMGVSMQRSGKEEQEQGHEAETQLQAQIEGQTESETKSENIQMQNTVKPPTPITPTTATITTTSLLPSGWDAAVAHVAHHGPLFQSRIDKLCGKDWYRLRRTLEVALSQDLTNTTTTTTTTTNTNTTTTTSTNTANTAQSSLFTGIRSESLSSLGYDVRCFFLCPTSRMDHAHLLDARCEDMICQGLLKETSQLRVEGLLEEESQPARAIGYRQALQYLYHGLEEEDIQEEDVQGEDGEEREFYQFLEVFQTATRQYSKKQMQWFRRDGTFVFVPVDVSHPSTKEEEEEEGEGSGALAIRKEQVVQQTAQMIAHMCQLSREEYEAELETFVETTESKTHETNVQNENEKPSREMTLSARTKKANEEQAKGMKFYKGGTRYVLKEKSEELRNVLREVRECKAQLRLQRKEQKKRSEGGGDL